jgi:putative transposase
MGMVRLARVVLPGFPHHITQRGNFGAQVFFGEEDYRLYLGLLSHYAPAAGVRILSYCLMPNHIHIVAIPARENSLEEGVGRVSQRYTQMVNTREGRRGHMWQDRYFSCPLEDAHLFRALRYVEHNPVRAGLVALPWEYRWSSANAHCGGTNYLRILDMAWWAEFPSAAEWRELLGTAESAEDLRLLRQHTASGRLLSNTPEEQRPKGRPRRAK